MKRTRRNFIGLMGVIAASAGFLSRLIRKSPKKPPAPIKMLTTDGRLVEVDPRRLPVTRKKATSSEVASWIWKNQKL